VQARPAEGEASGEFTLTAADVFDLVFPYTTLQELAFFLAMFEFIANKNKTFSPSAVRRRTKAYIPIVKFYYANGAEIMSRGLRTYSLKTKMPKEEVQKQIRQMRTEKKIDPRIASPFADTRDFTLDCLGRCGVVLPSVLSLTKSGSGGNQNEEGGDIDGVEGAGEGNSEVDGSSDGEATLEADL